MQNLRGKFIVLDGSEGCGKSTQILLLRERIEGLIPVSVVRDPGTTRIGEQIRAILLDPAHGEMAMRCEMLLYMAARAQMVAQTIRPALDRGELLLCDRFVSSTLAYQLDGDGLTFEQIRSIGDVAIGGRWPDLTLILDMPVERSMARVRRAKDRIEQRPIEYHQRVRTNFLAQAAADPARYRVINADRDRAEVHEDLWQALTNLATQ